MTSREASQLTFISSFLMNLLPHSEYSMSFYRRVTAPAGSALLRLWDIVRMNWNANLIYGILLYIRLIDQRSSRLINVSTQASASINNIAYTTKTDN